MHAGQDCHVGKGCEYMLSWLMRQGCSRLQRPWLSEEVQNSLIPDGWPRTLQLKLNYSNYSPTGRTLLLHIKLWVPSGLLNLGKVMLSFIVTSWKCWVGKNASERKHAKSSREQKNKLCATGQMLCDYMSRSDVLLQTPSRKYWKTSWEIKQNEGVIQKDDQGKDK